MLINVLAAVLSISIFQILEYFGDKMGFFFAQERDPEQESWRQSFVLTMTGCVEASSHQSLKSEFCLRPNPIHLSPGLLRSWATLTSCVQRWHGNTVRLCWEQMRSSRQLSTCRNSLAPVEQNRFGSISPVALPELCQSYSWVHFLQLWLKNLEVALVLSHIKQESAFILPRSCCAAPCSDPELAVQFRPEAVARSAFRCFLVRFTFIYRISSDIKSFAALYCSRSPTKNLTSRGSVILDSRMLQITHKRVKNHFFLITFYLHSSVPQQSKDQIVCLSSAFSLRLSATVWPPLR